MEGSSKHSKNDGLRRSQSKTVVYKNNLSTTFNKKSLRANNRALARALSKKKQEVSNLQNDYVKLLNQNNLLRLHLQGHDAEISKFYAEKFAQFRTTVSDAAKLLHSVCGQLIDISSNFENMSEFFQNLQSISLSKPTTVSQNVTTVRRPAQRVAVTQEETVNESEDEKMEEEEEKPAETRRYLDIIVEEPSRIDDTLDQNFASAVFDEDLDEKDVENGLDLDNSHVLSFNLNSSLGNKVGDVSHKLSFLINDVKTSINSSIHEIETFQQEDLQKNDNESFVKNKIALSRKKSRGSKPGQVKYNASKSDNPSKSRFKSFSGSQSQKSAEENEKVEVPTSGVGESESNKIGSDKINTKEKQSSVYDLSLDDSSYIAPPTLHKGQIPQDHHVPSVVLERIDTGCLSAKMDDDNHNAKESHGIMLRLGNGARTKPKDKTKNVRYDEGVKSDVNAASKSKSVENGESSSENSQKTDQPKAEKEKDPSNHSDVLKKTSKSTSGDAEEAPSSSAANVQKVREDAVDEDVDEEPEVNENIRTKTSKDDKVDLPERCSIESRSSTDGNSRKRRAASSVNYKEPSLNLKMRNPHSSSKRGKKSTS